MRIRIIFLLVLFGFLVGPGILRSEDLPDCFDHREWGQILFFYVDDEGFVDYDKIRAEGKSQFDNYIRNLEAADLQCNEHHQLAFWINAYNAHMVRFILARPQLKKISDDFKIFDEKFLVARATVTLNEIENRILRSDPKKGGPLPGLSLSKLDPRIHFALNCGAMDCPKLIRLAYDGIGVGTEMDRWLNKNAKDFANNPKHLRIENGRLIVSSLMKWYGDDFKGLGGVSAYLISLTDQSLRSDAGEIDKKLKLDFPNKTTFEYDWTLNSIRNKKEK